MSQQKKTGVLLINLGTPDAPTPAALRRYLAEFLWDKRVVDLPRPLWWLILHGIILRTRPARSAAAYQSVWSEEGAPLLVISKQQQRRLQAALGDGYHVALGMRYGNPSIASAMDGLRKAEVDELLVLPLYPQNSCSTTGSSFDAVADALKQHRFVPSLRFIADYHDHPLYIKALADAVRTAWQQRTQPEKLMISFHGTPRRFRDEGDLYFEHCSTTANLLAEELGLSDEQWLMTFQSRFGREEWLKPYTDEVLKSLPDKGIKSVDVICPGFSADCLETLEEIAVENRNHFIHAGGGQFHYIAALNADAAHIELIAELVTVS
ncbi:MAG: ferrochelatase [Chromatiales bacterium]|nr:ferrochelatase [Chromatiales bacterium]